MNPVVTASAILGAAAGAFLLARAVRQPKTKRPSSRPINRDPGHMGGRVLAMFADAEDSGRQLSRADVAKVMGYAFPSATSKHVDALERKGLITVDKKTKRNVRLTESGWEALGRRAGIRRSASFTQDRD
jgi:hypothetical protein